MSGPLFLVSIDGIGILDFQNDTKNTLPVLLNSVRQTITFIAG